MKKFLDILLIALLITLIFSFFTNNKATQNLDGWIAFKISDNSYTIPASVKLNITNNSTGALVMNSCSDISVNYPGKENISMDESFCKDLNIASGEKFTLDYSSQYDKFSDKGNYHFSINQNWEKHIETFDIKHKWTFSKLFTAMFYAPIYNLLIFLTEILGHTLGWGILALTVFIRMLLIWPQHKMMVSQKKLQTIQPKIKQIQKEFKGNQQMLGMKMMELYKKEQVNPMGSCGFLLIQMPILIVLYNVILNVMDPTNYFHLYQALVNYNLHDIQANFFGMDLLSSGGIVGVCLGITVGLIQFVQVKLSLADKKASTGDVVLEKKKDESDYSQLMPDPEMMNKFMLYGMPVMVAVFTYTLIAWVGLYWGMSTFFMIIQQLVVNKILKK